MLMSTAASSVSSNFFSCKGRNIPSSSISVFCGTGIYRNIDVLKRMMVIAAIESFVRRSSCISCCIIFEISDDGSALFLGFLSLRASTCFLVRACVKDITFQLCVRAAPVSRSILL